MKRARPGVGASAGRRDDPGLRGWICRHRRSLERMSLTLSQSESSGRMCAQQRTVKGCLRPAAHGVPGRASQDSTMRPLAKPASLRPVGRKTPGTRPTPTLQCPPDGRIAPETHGSHWRTADCHSPIYDEARPHQPDLRPGRLHGDGNEHSNANRIVPLLKRPETRHCGILHRSARSPHISRAFRAVEHAWTWGSSVIRRRAKPVSRGGGAGDERVRADQQSLCPRNGRRRLPPGSLLCRGCRVQYGCRGRDARRPAARRNACFAWFFRPRAGDIVTCAETTRLVGDGTTFA